MPSFTPAERADFIASLIISAAFLSLTILTTSRGRRDPVVWRLALLCINLFAYGIFELIGVVMHAGGHDTGRAPDWFDNATASLAPALFYDFVMSFVGRRRAMRTPIAAAYACCGIAAVFCLSPIAFRSLDSQSGGAIWALWMLVALCVLATHGGVVLFRHGRAASTPERARTRLVAAAVFIAGVANMTDLVEIAGASWSPHLGTIGLVVSAATLTVAALRVRSFERLSVLTAALAIAIAIVVVLFEMAMLRFVGNRSALAVGLTILATLGALLAMRFVAADYMVARERTLAHASLGRMAAQMTSDIKNPLAAMRETVQFLRDERVRGRSIDAQDDLLSVLVAQCDRVTRIVSQYHRIGRGDAQMERTDLNEVTREATRFLAHAATLDVRLADGALECAGDRDLLVIALENVLRNAQEAAPSGTLYVATGTSSTDARLAFVSVRDEGPKPRGSGVGLAFVRRIVEAHRGTLTVDTREGRGTTVRIDLAIVKRDTGT